MPRSTLKEWTEILTPWIQVIGLLAAAIFAVVEYQDKKKDDKVQRSATYLSQANTKEFIEARSKLLERQHNLVGRLRETLLAKSLTREQRNTAYFSFVVDELVMHGSGESLDTPFQLTLGFLEEGVVCSEQGLCDEAVIRANLSDFGRSFVHTYRPYLCYLRHVWNDPSIGKRVEEFYGPTKEDVCKEYQQSAQIAGRAAAKGEVKLPAAEPKPAADGSRRR